MNLEANETEDVKTIKPINKDTVHKICSGQVVLNLAVAVKELVENSLDAGATNVEIRLKNYGVDLIEVSDNGSGITEDNFSALTLKYHTSKLTEYSDLLGVSSFGFRGEALSSLCELADLTVTTKHHNSDYATKIEYDHKGNIVRKSPCARQSGTTVSLTNLFASLPVRQKEFHKNAKREFNKMTQLLYAYCLISVGVKIHCTNQTSLKATSTVVSTQGSPSYKDNIACVFGFKQLQSLLELKQEYTQNIKENILKGLSGEESTNHNCDFNIEDVEIDLSEDSNDTNIPVSQEDTLSEMSTKSQGHKNLGCPVKFTGLISSCAHGSGRSSCDRQFYFVNSRPCEPPKVSKLINEVYRQYNPNQYPFVFLNIILDRTAVDINVTPDKRKVFLTMEKVVLDVIKCSMLTLFESIPRTLKVDIINGALINEVKPEVDQPRIFQSFLQKFVNNSSKSKETTTDREPKCNEVDLKRKTATMLNFISAKARKIESTELDVNESLKEIEKDRNSITIKVLDIEETSPFNSEDNLSNISVKSSISHNESVCEESIDAVATKHSNDAGDDVICLESDNVPNTHIRTVDEIVEKSHTIICKNKSIRAVCSPIPVKINKYLNAEVVTDIADVGQHKKRTIQLKTSLAHVKALAEIYNNKKETPQAPERIKFRNKINPTLNPKCEEELSREISKDSFKQMAVVGQFNLGFIITKLDHDLFIIDQHATDEIYNFETLQINTELTSQKLVCPQNLELSGVNEQILIDNLPVFKKNGFTFAIDEGAMPCNRVKLLTVPMSKNWVFGKSDIEELLFMLRESPSEHCRPSRVRCMFASRACRKSVMVGTALAHTDMRRLVDHMADIDKPWNCPHGRPTIRHLVNLAMVTTKTPQES